MIYPCLENRVNCFCVGIFHLSFGLPTQKQFTWISRQGHISTPLTGSCVYIAVLDATGEDTPAALDYATGEVIPAA